MVPSNIPLVAGDDDERTIVEPPELHADHLPCEVKVVWLLDANDGELWQSEIVEALDVSKATVSRKLAALESQDAVSRLFFRGQKLVTLEATLEATES